MTVSEKICTKCKAAKAATLENFYRSQYSDGLSAQCRVCKIARVQQRTDRLKPEIQAYKHSWRLKNIDEIKRKKKENYLINREIILAKDRERNKLNPIPNRKRVAEWQKANPDRKKQWAKDNQHRIRGYVKASRSRRRARLRNADGVHNAADVRQRYAAQKGLCWWCKVDLNGRYHADHIIPLVKGGGNGANNICCACATCNLSKGGKMPHEWTDRLL